jgi:hypothetical protein
MRNKRRAWAIRFLWSFCAPYGVIYNIDQDGILVVAVAHLHRRPAYWQNRVN